MNTTGKLPSKRTRGTALAKKLYVCLLRCWIPFHLELCTSRQTHAGWQGTTYPTIIFGIQLLQIYCLFYNWIRPSPCCRFDGKICWAHPSCFQRWCLWLCRVSCSVLFLHSFQALGWQAFKHLQIWQPYVWMSRLDPGTRWMSSISEELEALCRLVKDTHD